MFYRKPSSSYCKQKYDFSKNQEISSDKAVTQIQPYISEQTVMLIMLMTKDEIEVYNYEYQIDSYEHSGFEYPY